MRNRFAWARLNAYGLLLVGLLSLSATDLLNPQTSNVARIVGRAPELQPAWTIGYIIAAVLLLVGFLRARTIPELAGLGLMVVGNTVQAAVVIGATDDGTATIRAVVIWVIVTGCAALRSSVLLSPAGLTVTIPGRSRTGDQ